MSNDSKLITIYRSQDKADYLIIEALLDSEGIEYFLLNAGVQNLFGGLNIDPIILNKFVVSFCNKLSILIAVTNFV